ncbi:MAG: DUF5011 domain-containing protein, partial [Verrucomicrobia bacterium]|nr:DUF5011 domain-containing protein [Verrucomicrobiota bacterium]
ADGTVVGWGNNFYGQANTPANATNVVAIAAGAYHSLALKGAGTIIGWGNYTDGQITVPASLYQLNLPITVNGTLDVNSPGTYALSYSITNALGAVATTNRTVIVADTLHPVLTLLGSNPLMHALGTPFLDPGVIATDLCAGDLIASVVTNLTVNPNVAGTYINTYTVTDLTGHTTQITRTVLVGNPLVTTLPASYMLNNTATLNGTVNPLAVATTAWFEWGTSVAYGTTSAASSLGSGTSTLAMNVALTNLTPGVAYHYRCVASNSFTIMGSGKDQLFWLPILTLKDNNPLTNECHVPFVDPGATVSIRPLTIAGGSAHSLALKADGTVVSWGHNGFGQTNTPPSATNVVGIAAGSQHSLALRADGTVIGWGATQYLNHGQSTIPASATNVMAIAAGSLHSLALKTNGTVIGWGNNGYGQTKSPASATNVVGIAAGGFHSLALKADGSVIGWGDNSSGQTNTPASATNVMAIAAGSSHNLALKADGTVVAWGDNTYGQTNTPAGATNVVAIAAGGGHSLALSTDGSVTAWGNNTSGQTNIPASVTNVVAIAAGGSHSLALKADGTIIGWGNNFYGQTNIPVSVYLLNLPITVSGTVDADNPSTYVLTYSATNALGAVATATRTVVILPSPLVNTLPVSGLLSNAATLNGSVIPWQADTTSWFEWGSTRAYGNSTVAIGVGGGTNVIAVGSGLTNLTSGLSYHYRCVASNSFGVGRGTDQSFSFWSPSLTLKGLNPVTNECHLPFVDSGATVNIRPLAIAAGYQHNLGLKANGTVIGWGANTYGQIIIPASATNVEAISAGGSHSLALKADGTIIGWGGNTYGQTTVPASATNVVAIAAGGSHSLALKADATVLGWGSGQTNTPASATNVTAIAAGGFHSLALRTNGTVVTWGDNTYGQTNTPASATNVIAIAAGNGHSLALKANGTVVGWGWNAYGQTTIPASATNVVAIAGGYLFSLALRADGTVVGWGNNTYGQTFIPAIATNVVAISAGYEHSLALKADGTVVGWGRNTYGQITIPAGVYQLNLPITVSGAVDMNSPGTYLLNYSTTNSLGAAVTASRTVVVADTLPPVLTLLGGNLLMHELGAPFVDLGVTATDLCAGDRTGNIFVWGTVSANVAGSYSLLYIVTDTSGNLAVTDRTVVVVTRPALTGLSRIGNGAFQFTFTNTPGARFNVLASTNVAQPLSEWMVLGPVTENPPGLFQFADLTATNRPVRYYRLRWP